MTEKFCSNCANELQVPANIDIQAIADAFDSATEVDCAGCGLKGIRKTSGQIEVKGEDGVWHLWQPEAATLTLSDGQSPDDVFFEQPVL